EGSLAWLVAGPQHDQQTGDQCQIDLDGHAISAGGQQMLAAQNTLEPAKEKFHSPAILVAQGDPSRVQVQAVGPQQENLGLTLAIGFAVGHLDDAQRLLEDRAASVAAKMDDPVADDASLTCLLGQWAFLDELEDGVVAETADEAGLGVDDILKQLVLGVTTINDVQPPRLQGGAEFLLFVAAALGDRGVTGNPLENIEVQVKFGGAMFLVDPQRPGHLRQGRQQAAIDGGQATQKLGIFACLQRQGLLGEFAHHSLQAVGVEDASRLAKRAQGGARTAELP